MNLHVYVGKFPYSGSCFYLNNVAYAPFDVLILSPDGVAFYTKILALGKQLSFQIMFIISYYNHFVVIVGPSA